nr:mechanosensitive ion channel family protein [Stutzerimonas stutzeri]
MQWDQYISQPALRTLAAALFVVLILSLFGRLLTALMLRLARAFLFTRELSEQLEKPI